jgi:hypothetical protein
VVRGVFGCKMRKLKKSWKSLLGQQQKGIFTFSEKFLFSQIKTKFIPRGTSHKNTVVPLLLFSAVK